MYLSSPARICFALGPGSVVLILGPTARVLVDMGSSEKTVVSAGFSVLRCGRIGELVAAEEVGAGLSRQRIGNPDHIDIIAGCYALRNPQSLRRKYQCNRLICMTEAQRQQRLLVI